MKKCIYCLLTLTLFSCSPKNSNFNEIDPSALAADQNRADQLAHETAVNNTNEAIDAIRKIVTKSMTESQAAYIEKLHKDSQLLLNEVKSLKNEDKQKLSEAFDKYKKLESEKFSLSFYNAEMRSTLRVSISSLEQILKSLEQGCTQQRGFDWRPSPRSNVDQSYVFERYTIYCQVEIKRVEGLKTLLAWHETKDPKFDEKVKLAKDESQRQDILKPTREKDVEHQTALYLSYCNFWFSEKVEKSQAHFVEQIEANQLETYKILMPKIHFAGDKKY